MSLSTRQKGDQYCELGFTKGTTEGDGSAHLPAGKDNKCTKSSIPWLGQSWTQPPTLMEYLTTVGTLLLFSTQGSLRATNQPVVNTTVGL